MWQLLLITIGYLNFNLDKFKWNKIKNSASLVPATFPMFKAVPVD